MRCYTYSLIASLSWGLYYPLVEKLLGRFSVVFVLILSQLLPALAASLLFHRQVAQDITQLDQIDSNDWVMISVVPIISLVANGLSYLAIRQKNASFVAFIEIAYPLFILIFTYVLFKEFQLTTISIVGALLILVGVIVLLTAG